MSDFHVLDLAKASDDDHANVAELYRKSGWFHADEMNSYAFLNRLIHGSFSFIAVYRDHELVGMGRAISDGVSDAYIQDVFVDPAYQKMGVGSLIIQNLVKTIQSEGISWIGLIGVPGSSEFYRKLGFQVMEDYIPMLKGE